MNKNNILNVILVGFSFLSMAAGPTEGQLAQFRQLDGKPLAELKNESLAQYLAARTVNQKATIRPSAGDMIAQCAMKQAKCEVAIPSRTDDIMKVHCVSIVSRSIAMALARNYESNFILLSRIVFKKGMSGELSIRRILS